MQIQISKFRSSPAFICITSVVVSASRNFNEEGVIYWQQLLWRLWMTAHLINTWSCMCMCLIYSFNILSMCTVSSRGSSPGALVCSLLSSSSGTMHLECSTHTCFSSNNSCNQKNPRTHTHTHAQTCLASWNVRGIKVSQEPKVLDLFGICLPVAGERSTRLISFISACSR